MKNLCIIQARYNATRLPGKVLLTVNEATMLEYEINRVKQAKKIDKIVVATTVNQPDNAIVELCEKIGVDYFRGSEDDVLNRYAECAKKYFEFETIIRITGDCPLIDPAVIDQVVGFFEGGDYDYVSNVVPPTFPDGMDVEVFTVKALLEADAKTKLASQREHPTLYIRDNKKNKLGNFLADTDYSDYRLTLDTAKDFTVIKFLIEKTQSTDSYGKYISLLDNNPRIKELNQAIQRNEGLAKSLSQDKIVK